ncbi:hypothetical protein MRB53_028533 [Persea americana]|uniref:Uncharacterized protein n=1 Tax=Persea americana TaxID=3435 RepID=A0ACC2KFU7_PERAE|nr:hypothetical protein MRB53_028533 [Persea americana]
MNKVERFGRNCEAVQIRIILDGVDFCKKILLCSVAVEKIGSDIEGGRESGEIVGIFHHHRRKGQVSIVNCNAALYCWRSKHKGSGLMLPGRSSNNDRFYQVSVPLSLFQKATPCYVFIGYLLDGNVFTGYLPEELL